MIYRWSICIHIDGIAGIYDDEEKELLGGIVEAADESLAHLKVEPLKPLAIHFNRIDLENDLNEVPKPDDLYVLIQDYRHKSIADLLAETDELLWQAKQLAKKEDEDEL